MSLYAAGPRPSFTTVLTSFAQADGLPFQDLLSAQSIQQACDREGVAFGCGPHDVFTPSLTLWALLSQCLSKDKSCAAATARVRDLLVSRGLTPCSANNGAYCKARAKLPQSLLRHLALDAGQRLDAQTPEGWLFKGRRVRLVDGTTVSAPDTQANQQRYPQIRTQKKGLGFPLIRLVVLLSFSTGVLLGADGAPWAGKETGETALLRGLLGQLARGDVLVADRYYCSYWMVALCRASGVDVCFRLHPRRHYDFSKGSRRGPDDHTVPWRRPPRPPWMDEANYQTVPEFLTVREVRKKVTCKGFRVREIILATTLLDAQAFSAEDLADLYHHRWHVELDIRAIKQTLKMDILRGKTPEMLHREIWTHLLAYNLVRQAMAQAASEHGLLPRQLSFAGAVQQLDAARASLSAADGDPEQACKRTRALRLALSQLQVPQRPGRCEPRKVKRRPKDYKLLTRPRNEERQRLQAGKGPDAG